MSQIGMPDMHVTFISEVSTKKAIRFVTTCTCGWKSGKLGDRAKAVVAGAMHRANAKVQGLPG